MAITRDLLAEKGVKSFEEKELYNLFKAKLIKKKKDCLRNSCAF